MSIITYARTDTNNNDPYKIPKATRVNINNWINNNKIYQTQEHKITTRSEASSSKDRASVEKFTKSVKRPVK